MSASAVESNRTPAAPSPSSCPPARPSLTVHSHGRTDPGLKRPNNEDQFVIAALSKALHVQDSSLEQPEVQFGDPLGHLFVVADGCGGHAGGEKASQLAVRSIEHFIVETLNWCASFGPARRATRCWANSRRRWPTPTTVCSVRRIVGRNCTAWPRR